MLQGINVLLIVQDARDELTWNVNSYSQDH